VDDLNQLIATGAIDSARVEAQLDSEEIDLLDAKINASGWYDIQTYHRMVGLLFAAEGGDLRTHWEERGRRAARRMADSGIYLQFDYLGRTKAGQTADPEQRFAALGKDLRLLLSLQAAVLNFGDWKAVVDPDFGDRYRIEISGIAGIPDGIFLATAGTVNEMSILTKTKKIHHWKYERDRPDRVLIRMTEPA
jgi:hypothetical protein